MPEELQTNAMKKLFDGVAIHEVRISKRTTERGELLKYFAGKLQVTIPRVAYLVTGFDISTLYFLKSDCDQAERRGVAWGAAFHTAVKWKKQ